MVNAELGTTWREKDIYIYFHLLKELSHPKKVLILGPCMYWYVLVKHDNLANIPRHTTFEALPGGPSLGLDGPRSVHLPCSKLHCILHILQTFMDLKLVFWELSPQNIYNKNGLQTGFPRSK